MIVFHQQGRLSARGAFAEITGAGGERVCQVELSVRRI